jgi:hypothetical protein
MEGEHKLWRVFAWLVNSLDLPNSRIDHHQRAARSWTARYNRQCIEMRRHTQASRQDVWSLCRSLGTLHTPGRPINKREATTDLFGPSPHCVLRDGVASFSVQNTVTLLLQQHDTAAAASTRLASGPAFYQRTKAGKAALQRASGLTVSS